MGNVTDTAPSPVPQSKECLATQIVFLYQLTQNYDTVALCVTKDKIIVQKYYEA